MKIRNLTLFTIMLALVLSPHEAEAKKRHHTPHHAHHHHAGVDRGAGYSDIVIDAETGRVIHDVDGDDLRHPASLTKMMTLYITFQALESGRLGLDQYMVVSENAAYQSPSKLGLHAGQHIRVEDAILGIVTESANDAAVTIGETLGGSEEGFGRLMTKQARALGMSQTIFRNPSGLPDPEQVTTAHDMAILGAALIQHYPRFYPYFSHDSFTYAGIYHHNHNHLMDRYDGMDGIKTGYIRASGFNLVASAKHGNLRLIGVVFGGRSAVARDNHMAQLLDQSFEAAEAEARTGRISPAVGEGDSNDAENGEYVALPAKVAAIFPSRDALAPQPAAQDQDETQAQPPVQQVVQRPAPLPKGGKNWGIQIGAYSDEAIGQQALASLIGSMPALLSGGQSQVEKVSAGGAVMFRARLMSLDKRTAQSVCSYLVQHSKSCLTVGP
ncbi:MAG: D-alanyl-D-alanine carboxypeptidase family protein [Alphaproteobacteria bacterium]